MEGKAFERADGVGALGAVVLVVVVVGSGGIGRVGWRGARAWWRFARRLLRRALLAVAQIGGDARLAVSLRGVRRGLERAGAARGSLVR